MPFYEACLKKSPACGKEYQKPFKEAQMAFIRLFPQEWQEKLANVFSEGTYYPQEIVKSKELQTIWRESDWKNLNSRN